MKKGIADFSKILGENLGTSAGLQIGISQGISVEEKIFHDAFVVSYDQSFSQWRSDAAKILQRNS